TRVGVVGGDIAADAILDAGIADDDLVLDDARDTGDGIRLGLVDGDHTPDLLTGTGVQGDQATVDGANEDLALPHGYTAVDHITAGVHTLGRIDFGVIGPQLGAAAHVVGLHMAPGGTDVHRAIDHDWRGLLGPAGVDICVPGQLQLIHVIHVNLVERAVALFAIVTTDAHPGARLAVSGNQSLGGNRATEISSCGTRSFGGRRRQRRR